MGLAAHLFSIPYFAASQNSIFYSDECEVEREMLHNLNRNWDRDEMTAGCSCTARALWYISDVLFCLLFSHVVLIKN